MQQRLEFEQKLKFLGSKRKRTRIGKLYLLILYFIQVCIYLP